MGPRVRYRRDIFSKKINKKPGIRIRIQYAESRNSMKCHFRGPNSWNSLTKNLLNYIGKKRCSLYTFETGRICCTPAFYSIYFLLCRRSLDPFCIVSINKSYYKKYVKTSWIYSTILEIWTFLLKNIDLIRRSTWLSLFISFLFDPGLRIQV